MLNWQKKCKKLVLHLKTFGVLTYIKKRKEIDENDTIKYKKKENKA